jgi:HD superfamily phosphohydrolase
MSISLSPDEKLKLDRADLAATLAALVSKKRSGDGDAMVSALVDTSAKPWSFRARFEFQFEEISLVCPEGARIIRSGGSALVLECHHRDQPRLRFALKVPRKSIFAAPGKGVDEVEKEAELSDLEYINHAPLSHRNIVRLFVAHLVRYGAFVAPALLVEWIDDSQRLCDHLCTALPKWPTVVDLLVQIFEGLEHVHANGLVHWDMKSDNILVGGDGVPRVSDIGNARLRGGGSPLHAFSTLWNIPPQLMPKGLSKMSGLVSRRVPIEVPDAAWDSAWLDLWMLGRELNRLFGADEATLDLDRNDDLRFPEDARYEEIRKLFLDTAFPDGDGEAQYALEFIRLIIRRLLSSASPDGPIYYSSARAVASDLSKMDREFGAAHNIPELQAIPQHVIRQPQSGNVPLPIRVKHFLNATPVLRLKRHLQLGVAREVYPGATHCRAEHLIGVLAAVTQYVRALYADRNDPFWRLNIEKEDVEALLVAALLHDVGHIAFGHAIEEMTGLLAGRMHEDYAQELTLGVRSDTSKLTGEVLRDREIVERWLIADFGVPGASVQKFLTKVAAILRPPETVLPKIDLDGRLIPSYSERFIIQILHSIVDSAIDADKLDYLLRDAHHCGVQYANGIDIDRFFQALTCITPEQPANREDNTRTDACIGISTKGILPAESILVARYQMFGSVYWHHTVRALDAMLQFAVQSYVAAIGYDLDIENHEIAKRIGDRLDRLISEFRQRGDEDALKWLASELDDNNLPVSPSTRQVLRAASEGLLGNRDLLYRKFFELRYDRDPTPGEHHREAIALASHFQTIADAIAQAETPLTYLRKVRELRQHFVNRLQTRLEQLAPHKKIAFEEGEILIDIPPHNKDRIEGVYVLDEGLVKRIQDVSPVANAVGEAFHLWVRSVRVFVAPAARDRCLNTGYTVRSLHQACEDVMAGVTQLRLFGFGAGSGTAVAP